MNWKNKMALQAGLGAILLAALTGCVGYVDGGGGEVVVPGPDLYLFGGPYEGRGYVHGYSHRGFVSRGGGHGGGGARGGGGHGGGHR